MTLWDGLNQLNTFEQIFVAIVIGILLYFYVVRPLVALGDLSKNLKDIAKELKAIEKDLDEIKNKNDKKEENK